MNKIARLSSKDREALFRNTANEIGELAAWGPLLKKKPSLTIDVPSKIIKDKESWSYKRLR